MKRPFGRTEIVPGISSIPSFIEDIFSSFPTPGFNPAIDVYEDKDNWYVKLEAPGMAQKDIKISIEADVLTIQGEKKHEETFKDKNVHRVESRYGTFMRELTLPSTADPSRANASYKEGVLTITFPKKEESKKRTINIDVK
jgi:HSP20 family protein